MSTLVFPAPGPAITRVIEYRGLNVASTWEGLSSLVIRNGDGFSLRLKCLRPSLSEALFVDSELPSTLSGWKIVVDCGRSEKDKVDFLFLWIDVPGMGVATMTWKFFAMGFKFEEAIGDAFCTADDSCIGKGRVVNATPWLRLKVCPVGSMYHLTAWSVLWLPSTVEWSHFEQISSLKTLERLICCIEVIE